MLVEDYINGVNRIEPEIQKEHNATYAHKFGHIDKTIDFKKNGNRGITTPNKEDATINRSGGVHADISKGKRWQIHHSESHQCVQSRGKSTIAF